jgi:hypothetical protein
VLNVFCKVRGEKVIKGFFNNEPRYLLPILNELEIGRNYRPREDGSTLHEHAVPWTERYILLLWLSHLMLAPFPLESMSGLQSSEQMSALLGVELPAKVPAITIRVLAVCVARMRSASKERTAAATLLVRLCSRPDMQKLGLLNKVVGWSVSFLESANESETDIHQCLGALFFISGIVASTTKDEVGRSLSMIYHACRSILDKEGLAYIRSSAVARKSIVKTLRNIVLHCLHSATTLFELNSTPVLEEVVEFLLEAVTDGDTPVRYGASKALSIITLKLDSEMGEEVVEAILGSLNESVYWEGSERNLSGVNALRWHGLTLTLAQLLYRKAISTSKLPDVLNALLLSLSFEQRSPTGGSIGTNVRDSACFGVWALSRRYATSDLLAVETTSIRACEHKIDLSVPQALAIELLTVACLDPAGNIRRGSSAALQELIGRHPNIIEHGIPLVQVVDFHAVGLRQRAMCDVATKASALHPLYWQALFEHLLGWRGTGSLDKDSRFFAAKAIGLLSKLQPPSVLHGLSNQVRHQLAALRPRQVEERQGLVSALAAIVETSTARKALDDEQNADSALITAKASLLDFWQLLTTELMLEDKAFMSPALRPELTASSIAFFIAAMAGLTVNLPRAHRPKDVPFAEVVRVLNLCLARHEESVLGAIRLTLPIVISLLSVSHEALVDTVTRDWLSQLETEASYNGSRCAGHALALGSTYSVLHGSVFKDHRGLAKTSRRIIEVLTFRCTPAVAIEARTIALRALSSLLEGPIQIDATTETQIITALHIALNDYTITERGDVGSLVRTEALEAVRTGWETGSLRVEGSELHQQVHADVLRLSLEKLDKIRGVAARTLRARRSLQQEESLTPLEEVSSVTYFLTALQKFQSTAHSIIQEAICLGYVNSAGLGSESVAQNARRALLVFLDALPVNLPTAASQISLSTVANCMLVLLKANVENDRVLLPLLETIAFLFDMNIMQRLVPSSAFKYVYLGIDVELSDCIKHKR